MNMEDAMFSKISKTWMDKHCMISPAKSTTRDLIKQRSSDETRYARR